MRGRSAVALVITFFIVKLQPEVGFLPVILQGHRGVIGLFRFLRPAVNEMKFALVQQSGGGIPVEGFFLGGKKAVVLPKGEPAGRIFTEKALLALSDITLAPGAGTSWRGTAPRRQGPGRTFPPAPTPWRRWPP